MQLLLLPILSLLFVGEAFGQGANLTLADLPEEILSELLTILSGQSLNDTSRCTDPVASDIDLLLYTRTNPQDPVALDANNPSKIDGNKKLILIIHGWIQSSNGYGMQELKDAYLSRYDCNVVIVNWQKLAWDLYTRAVCKLPKVAKFVTNFLCLISEQSNIPLDTVHLVGHSLGGQMSGFIGQFSVATCSQSIGRITALDPAGPLYTTAPTENRLDSSDAKFIDVLHTNGGIFGFLRSCGHADFFVNCGTLQPGCIIPKIDLNDLINIPIMAVGCPHFRAMDLMVEGVHTNNFKAIPCENCPFLCPPFTSIFKTKIVMGEQCPVDARGGYYTLTDFRPPFALTPQLHL